MLWQIFARYENAEEEWANECYRHGFIAIGWESLGNLTKYSTRGDLKKALASKYVHKHGANSIRADAGTIWSFAHRVNIGDIVLCPDAIHKRCYVGTIASEYYYDRYGDKDQCPFPHRRRVKWNKRIVSYSEIKAIWKYRPQITLSHMRKGEERLIRLLHLKPLKPHTVQGAVHKSPTFIPEFFGVRKPYKLRGVVAARTDHGRIIHELAERLIDLGFKIANDKPRDVYILDGNDKMLVLFEVKTDISTSSLYEAIGQLMFHGSAQANKAVMVAVLPIRNKSESNTMRAFRRLGIRVLCYRWRINKPIFHGLASLMKSF